MKMSNEKIAEKKLAKRAFFSLFGPLLLSKLPAFLFLVHLQQFKVL
jgi:hypothetical protein